MKAFWRTQRPWILGVAAVLLLLAGWLAIRYLVPRPVIRDTAEVWRVTAEYWDEPVELDEAAEKEILEVLSELRCTRTDTFKGFFFSEDRAVCIQVYEGLEHKDICLGDDSVVQIWGGRREGYYRLKNPQEVEERLTAILLPLLPETKAGT